MKFIICIITFSIYFSQVLPAKLINAIYAYDNGIEYINPLPNTNSANNESKITIYPGIELGNFDLTKFKIILKGTKSGNIDFTFKTTLNKNYIIISPIKKFEYGEIISVNFINIPTKKGGIDFNYNFQIVDRPYEYHNEFEIIAEDMKKPIDIIEKLRLSDTLPEIRTEIYMPDALEEGYYFFAPYNINQYNYLPQTRSSLIIVDEKGTQVFTRRADKPEGSTPRGFFDFKMQDDTTITYYDNRKFKFFVLNELMEIIDSVQCGNGYFTDFHDIQLLPNGNWLLLAYPSKKVDMSQYIEGADTSALVFGSIFQEIDKDGNVLYEWNSFDHIPVIDMNPERCDFKNNRKFDYMHTNSIQKINGTNYLLSCRNLDQILEIDGKTGDVIWRAGLGESNQFSFESLVDGESATFSGQHYARMLPNGIISLFDNGAFNPEHYSRACEYEIDTINKIAKLINVTKGDTANYGYMMGNVQYLENGNKIVGWGTGRPDIIEFTPDGSEALHLEFYGYNYRAYKFNWLPKNIIAENNLYEYDLFTSEEPVKFTVKLTNNTTQDFELNKFQFRNPANFSVDEDSVMLPAGSSANITVKFSANIPGTYNDVITISDQTSLEKIGTQVKFNINVALPVSDRKDGQNTFEISPNPATDNANITLNLFNDSYVNISLSDIYGHETSLVSEHYFSGSNKIPLQLNDFASGMYFVKIVTNDKVFIQKLITNK